jgi:predicted permease
VPSPSVKPRLDGWKFRWDVVLFLAFVLAAMCRWTGLPLHELLGAMVVPVLAVHLWLNWSWIVDVLRRPSRALRGEVRFNRAWDLAQTVVALVAIGSGLGASQYLFPALAAPFARNRIMEDVHAISAWVLMVMIGIHLGVHLSWVWSKVRKPQFALMVVLIALVVAEAARLQIFRGMGVSSRRLKKESIQVAFAIVPSALVAYRILALRRRRRPTPTE